ncbi:glycoside hydrolase family 29 [Lacihabitans sp. CCS-44]|uniref:alpha-L-fucosidase n=1 Tax=Lacihabitans sp. CCS-44 TaxID=2487331 RepID=UPI0020CDFAF9|nr:alpha-L-fucosidase [Lacihabitans sp. CCS-44]MCP9755220.1 glycoside hydrolase family 29 [Lacihabitans sp. CCS-44]
MKTSKYHVFFALIFAILSCKTSQISSPKPVFPIPTADQLAWHELETYAFIHFTTNTFTGKEWGYGDESPSIFNPTDMDVDQWVKTIKDAGLKAVILTCKHHDGFVLWPSKFTNHSVAASPYKNGKGDVVKEVSEACKKYGLKFGVYLSPWDRNRADYGSPSYVEYYRNQLKELFAAYGPIFEMWFDGANGGDGFYGGTKEMRKINGKTFYDWPKTIELVRELEPKILFFSDAGPEIRWVGNERGLAGKTNWNNISRDTLYAGKAGIESLLNTGNENGKDWVPAEVDVSIRPGWFYHAEEDVKVKTAQQLFDIYMTSVGRGSNLLLNIPPDKRGQIHEIDVANLIAWKKLLNERFSENLAKNASVSVSSNFNKKLAGTNLTDGNTKTYWAASQNSKNATIEIDLNKLKTVNFVEMQEYIALGQRVKSFAIDTWNGSNWKEAANETTIGYKRIIKITTTQTQKIRIRITDAKAGVILSEVKVW